MGVDKQLAIPALAAKDPRSFELLRVWIAEGSQAITLQPGIWQDPAAWGVMLADLARNIVTVHADADPDLDTGNFLAAMLEGFDTEIESVLNEVEGGDDQDQEAG